MKEKIRYLKDKKIFHICMIIIIITVILFVLAMIVVKYSVEGEKNMPFNLSKVTIISSVEGIDKDSGENKWAFDVNQNNDIYLYIEKNKNYNAQALIKNIIIDNISVQKENQKGTINFYKPNGSIQGGLFYNIPENLAQTIEYVGAMESNFGNLEVANQGGIIAFRYSNDKIGEYISNDEEINHSQLLKKANIDIEDLKAKIAFDLIIKTEEQKEYKATLNFDMPIDEILDKGTTSKEITDLEDIVFKRIKN